MTLKMTDFKMHLSLSLFFFLLRHHQNEWKEINRAYTYSDEMNQEESDRELKPFTKFPQAKKKQVGETG